MVHLTLAERSSKAAPAMARPSKAVSPAEGGFLNGAASRIPRPAQASRRPPESGPGLPPRAFSRSGTRTGPPSYKWSAEGRLPHRGHPSLAPPPTPFKQQANGWREGIFAQSFRHEGALRRDPVGEENGVPSGRRARADSVASQASLMSHVSSRHPRKADKSPSRGGFFPSLDHYGSRDMYDPHTYYYYYQKYYENHPYYREYYRQMMKQYGYSSYPADPYPDERGSIQSGRSSVNDDLKKSNMSSQFLQDFTDRSSVGGYEPSAICPEVASLSHMKSYPSGELSGVPSVTDEAAPETTQRMTPLKFGRPHLVSRFDQCGKLILVLPNDPKDGEKGIVQIRDAQRMLSVHPDVARSIQEMKEFQGPLTFVDTHKDLVIRYCEKKASEAQLNDSITDRSSVVLMYQYLALLVKQNGKVCGADLAKLLLQESRGGDSLGRDGNEVSNSESRLQQLASHDEPHLIGKFTEFLCLGRKKEALDFAMKEGLWGYALVLSAKMDSSVHARVMASFIDSIPSSNVMHTLFQQLSGKKPDITKSFNPERWGSWRRHLAVMLSNPSGLVIRDNESVISLGNMLAARGQIHAAHFCYLAACAEFDLYSEKNAHMVLIGANHHLQFQEFASSEAINCTEIYEFARSLDDHDYTLPAFQSYKLIYAHRLAECGFATEALKYCEVICQAVSRNPVLYHCDFVSHLWELAEHLKFHDLHYQIGDGEATEMPDPLWLQNIRHVLENLLYSSGPTESSPEKGNQEVLQDKTTSEPCETAQDTTDSNTAYQSSLLGHVIQSAAEDTKESSALHERNDQSVAQVPVNDPSAYHASHYNYSSQWSSVPVAASQIPQEVTSLGSVSCEPPASVTSPNESPRDISQHSAPPFQPQDLAPQSSFLPPMDMPQTVSRPSQDATHQQPMSLPSQDASSIIPSWESQSPYSLPDLSPPAEPPRLSNQASDSLPAANLSPERTAEEEEYWAMMTGKKKSNNSQEAVETKGPQEARSSEAEDSNDANKDMKEKRGFFSKIFGWNSNQANLPDDRNPSIVWDENAKKWVNKDAAEGSSAQLAPPPKAMGLPSAQPGLRGGPRKSRYVNPVSRDSMKKSSVAPPIPSFGRPLLPQAPSAGPFVPQDLAPQSATDGGQLAPALMREENSQMVRGRYISESSSIDLEDDAPKVYQDQVADEGVSDIPMGNPMGHPMFFNPAQFTGVQNTASSLPRKAGPARRAMNPTHPR